MRSIIFLQHLMRFPSFKVSKHHMGSRPKVNNASFIGFAVSQNSTQIRKKSASLK